MRTEGETRGHFYWWRLGLRCKEPKAKVEQEDTQVGEGHIDIRSVAQEPPLLETSLISLIDTLVERVGHTTIELSVDEMLLLNEVSGDTKVPEP